MKKGLLFIFLVGLGINLFPYECSGSLIDYVEESSFEVEIDICEQIDTIKRAPVPKGKCPKRIDEYGYSNEELVLMAQITVAEAEGESEYGKRLVIDTILNRKDSGYFPDTVTEVIYQPNQFSCIANGRFDRVKADGETVDLVVQEIKDRSNYDVIFFCAGGYSAYGTPLLIEGNHYFSSH